MRRSKGSKERFLTSVLGLITCRRTYFVCETCQEKSYAADDALGIVGSLTQAARELVCLAGIGCGFKKATERLRRFCGWSVSEQTMRRTCEAEGKRVERWRQGQSTADLSPPPRGDAEAGGEAVVSAATAIAVDPPPPPAVDPLPRGEASAAFRAAEGAIEFSTDGTMVNTVDGWREIRLAAWLKRPAGEPASAAEWKVRQLPKPTARAVLIDIAGAEDFGARWRGWSARLGITDPEEVTVLADGAEWIWNQVAIQFPGATGVLDIYHATEHLAAATKQIHGENPGAQQAWYDRGVQSLLRDGWEGICRWTAEVREQSGVIATAATEPLLGYFSKHTQHLGYQQRLKTGRSIGSGAIEGANKQLVGKRLKQTGARWRPENAVRVATLFSAEAVGDWDLYWQSPLAFAA